MPSPAVENGKGGLRMTEPALESLGLRFLEQELKGNRYVKDYCTRMIHAAQQFLDWLPTYHEKGITQLHKDGLLAYQAYLGACTNPHTGKPLALSTIKHRYEGVKKLYSVLYRTGAITENPAQGLSLERPEARTYKRRPLSREEITTFLESISTETDRGLRNCAFFELVYSSGLRLSEAVNLKIGSIDFDRRELIVRGKFDRERLVPLSDVARDFLLCHLGNRRYSFDEYVFPESGTNQSAPLCRTSISRIFRKLIKACGMDKPELCTHSIRHSTATHLLDNGAGVRQVQELLGHKSIESTVLYTHVQTEGLARIYRKYHPREHELYETIDDDYERRLESILQDHRGQRLTGGRLPSRNEKRSKLIKKKEE
jgi:integrase/recombinase XerD